MAGFFSFGKNKSDKKESKHKSKHSKDLKSSESYVSAPNSQGQTVSQSTTSTSQQNQQQQQPYRDVSSADNASPSTAAPVNAKRNSLEPQTTTGSNKAPSSKGSVDNKPINSASSNQPPQASTLEGASLTPEGSSSRQVNDAATASSYNSAGTGNASSLSSSAPAGRQESTHLRTMPPNVDPNSPLSEPPAEYHTPTGKHPIEQAAIENAYKAGNVDVNEIAAEHEQEKSSLSTKLKNKLKLGKTKSREGELSEEEEYPLPDELTQMPSNTSSNAPAVDQSAPPHGASPVVAVPAAGVPPVVANQQSREQQPVAKAYDSPAVEKTPTSDRMNASSAGPNSSARPLKKTVEPKPHTSQDNVANSTNSRTVSDNKNSASSLNSEPSEQEEGIAATVIETLSSYYYKFFGGIETINFNTNVDSYKHGSLPSVIVNPVGTTYRGLSPDEVHEIVIKKSLNGGSISKSSSRENDYSSRNHEFQEPSNENLSRNKPKEEYGNLSSDKHKASAGVRNPTGPTQTGIVAPGVTENTKAGPTNRPAYADNQRYPSDSDILLPGSYPERKVARDPVNQPANVSGFPPRSNMDAPVEKTNTAELVSSQNPSKSRNHKEKSAVSTQPQSAPISDTRNMPSTNPSNKAFSSDTRKTPMVVGTRQQPSSERPEKFDGPNYKQAENVQPGKYIFLVFFYFFFYFDSN